MPRSRHLVSAWPVNSRVVELTVCGHNTLSLALLAFWCVTAASHPLLRRASGSWPPGWLAGGQTPLRRGQGVGAGRWDEGRRERDTEFCRSQGCSGQWVVLYFGGVLRPCGGSHIWEEAGDRARGQGGAAATQVCRVP